MKIEVRERPRRTGLFWLSREEDAGDGTMRSLRAQFKIRKARGYLPVVFESGVGSLEDSLYLLMKRNYEALVKKDLVAEAAMHS